MSDKNDIDLLVDYAELFDHIKKDILQSQLRAIIAVNHELIMLYWRIGKSLAERIEEEKWGAKILDNLSNDLRKTFPEIAGFSVRNLKYMRTFAKIYHNPNWAAAAAQIPWGHNTLQLSDHLLMLLMQLLI